MRQLVADIVTFDFSGGIFTLAFAAGLPDAPTSYLILQRDVGGEGSSEIHLELDGQKHSGYGLVSQAKRSHGRLEVALTRPIGSPPSSVILVLFHDSGANRASVERGVRKILSDVMVAGAA